MEKSIHRFTLPVLLAGAAGLGLLSAGNANAKLVIPQQLFTEFNGSLPSLDFPTGSGTVPTGPISLHLDPSLRSTAKFDDSTLTSKFILNLLINFPLLATLGESPLPIKIVEIGPYSIVDNSLTAIGFGGGVVGGNSIFAGTIFSNENKYKVGVKVDNEGEPSLEAGWEYTVSNGTLTPPMQSPISIELTGTASSVSVPGPLPILGIAAAFSYSRKLRKRLKSSKPEVISTTAV